MIHSYAKKRVEQNISKDSIVQLICPHHEYMFFQEKASPIKIFWYLAQLSQAVLPQEYDLFLDKQYM